MFKILMRSPWSSKPIEVGDFYFSRDFSWAEADALVALRQPHPDLLTFPGPKAWYCCEARKHEALFAAPEWRSIIAQLKPEETLYHAHPDPYYRVPHVTQRLLKTAIPYPCTDPRLPKAVAVVSNTGGAPEQRSREMMLRNTFATHPAVDIYGKRNAWERFQADASAKPQTPPNYKGELPGGWSSPDRLACIARYKAAICFENALEPYYFTEKFVCSVLGGCIPIYHADPVVRAHFLQGAAWVDPVDFAFDPEATIRFALAQDTTTYWELNTAWLQSEPVRATCRLAVYERIGTILRQRGTTRKPIEAEGRV